MCQGIYQQNTGQMKHVFVIHSHITFLVAMGTVNLLKLSQSQVIFLYGRNYRISCIKVPYKTIDISSFYRPSPTYLFNCFQQWKYIRKVDKFISNEIADSYYVYIPHTGFEIFQILLTHPLCKGLNLIQEGAVTYFTRRVKWKSVAKNIITIFNKRTWYQSNWFIPNHFYREKETIRTFACNETFFLPLNKARNFVIKLPSYPLNIQIQETNPVFVFETAVEVKLIDRDIYMEACRKMIRECARENNYIKFHPNQSEANKETIRSFFAGVHYQELSMDIPFELILSSYANLTVCGFTSSLMFFAKELGHGTKNYTSELTKRSRKFASYVHSMHHE